MATAFRTPEILVLVQLMLCTDQRSRDHVESRSGDLFLERIPESIYEDLAETLTRRYGFLNGEPAGGRLRLADYFIGLRRSAAGALMQCVRDMLQGACEGIFPELPVPEGFEPRLENLPAFDRSGGVAFGYFDAAVTADGLRIIEVQSNATYIATAASASLFLQRSLVPSGSVFVQDPEAGWSDLIDLYQELVVGPEGEGAVIADRDLLRQKTNFEHYAAQRELAAPVDVVDTRWIFERDGCLWYQAKDETSPLKKVRRLYHRTLVLEAIEEDGYPNNSELWRFRFDRAYSDLVHVNHPGTNFWLSKHILPYVPHPLNPECYELTEISGALKRRELNMDDFVWKHKLGVAGRGLFLLPDANLLAELTEAEELDGYIAQKKVEFERFETADGREKIIELRFMSIQSEDRLLVVPMARLGHVRTHPAGRQTYHIHFAENNRPGYGFCPVLIVDE